MDQSVLDQLILGYGVLVDARRQVHAARLTCHSLYGAGPAQAHELAGVLADAWPEESGQLLLNPTSEGLLTAWLNQALPPHLVLEVPAFLVADQAGAARVMAAAERGNAMVLKGRPLAALSQPLLKAFRHAVVDLEDDRRLGPAPDALRPRHLPFVQGGVHTLVEANDSFRRGALAVQGWPLGDAPQGTSQRRDVPASVQAVMDLIQRVEREEPANRIEDALRANPALAFRLMRFINSPGFGLSVEVSSFQHAIMILGYRRLKRWLALLLASAVDDPDLKPLMFLAVRRGLFMEALAAPQGDDTLRGEAFICGVFSLLDRMMRQPFTQLLETLPVPERVAQALRDDEGPFARPLSLAKAVESELPMDIEAALGDLMITPGELSRAVLHTLTAARQLQSL